MEQMSVEQEPREDDLFDEVVSMCSGMMTRHFPDFEIRMRTVMSADPTIYPPIVVSDTDQTD